MARSSSAKRAALISSFSARASILGLAHDREVQRGAVAHAVAHEAALVDRERRVLEREALVRARDGRAGMRRW